MEVALTHLISTILFLKLEGVCDQKIKNKKCIIRNALAHAGEVAYSEKPNIEIDESGAICFRTKNNGGEELKFNNKTELGLFIGEINTIFSRAL